MASPAECLSAALAAVPPRRRLVVGVSGGVDSMLLLDLARRHAAAAGGIPLLAVHVHHGLHPHADDWAAHVERACAAAGVPCVVRRVIVASAGGREAAARAARYAAFAGLMEPGDALLLAHHADDQAETLLLRLLRGSGLSGLGAMRPARRLPEPADAWLVRPLLPLSRAGIEAEAARCGLSWVEDPSNADRSLDRNRLRHDVLPLLASRWPAVVPTLAATAERLAEADELLNEYLDRELPALLGTAPGWPDDRRPALAVAPLLAQAPARQRALLRRWLWRCGAPAFQSDWLEQLRGLARARSDAEGALQVGGWEVHRHRGWLVAFPRLPVVDAGRAWPWPDPAVPPELGAAHGRLRTDAGGLALALPPGAVIEVRLRRGGECLRPATGAGEIPAGASPAGLSSATRPLKKVLQDRDVPPWLRGRIPLLYVDGILAAVGDCVADVAFLPTPARPATLQLRWEPPGNG